MGGMVSGALPPAARPASAPRPAGAMRLSAPPIGGDGANDSGRNGRHDPAHG
jgi:hypothetical protein